MPSQFVVLVTGSPNCSQAHLTAQKFVEQALRSGHRIDSIFFYQEAVIIANRFVIKPDDEAQLAARWQKLAEKENIELQVCIAAANRRGVISQEEALQHSLDHYSLNPAFNILGLGQLAASLTRSDIKLVQFK